MKVLTIISHTEHYVLEDGTIVGWGPTITEINHLLSIFSTIYHVAMLHDKAPPPSALPYISNRVVFVSLPALGGPKVTDKLKLVYNIPKVLAIVNKTLKHTDYFQLRVPTGMGVFLIPYLNVFVKKKGWYKYAGNWNQKNPPMGYGMQRAMLKKQSRVVTINGRWPNQSENCLTFENPCLTKKDLEVGEVICNEKRLDEKISFCYVGRLERPKGVERIIKAIENLNSIEKNKIHTVHLVGDGDELDYFKSLSKATGVDFEFHGFLSRNKVFDIYKKSHFFIMPTTASEGFPKVIAEAMNFGCIPIVSLVSSIGQYIKHLKTGICIQEVELENVTDAIKTALELSDQTHKNIILNQRNITKLFSFEYYNNRIKSEIL